MSTTPYLSVLAPELLHLIAKYLGPPSLNRLIQTNTRFYDIFNDQLWAMILKSANQHGLVTSIFKDASRTGNMPLMLKLDEILGVDDETKEYSLLLAAECGRTCAVEYLLNSHDKPEKLCECMYFPEALSDAAGGGYLEIVRALLQYGPSPQAVYSALMRALESAHGEVARELFPESRRLYDISSLDTQRAKGWSSNLLEFAVRGADPALVAMVLQCHPDVDQRTSEGQTPLHIALRGENLDVAQLLLGEGCDIEKKYHGLPALAVARSANAIELLFEYGASLDTIDWAKIPHDDRLQRLDLLKEHRATIETVQGDPTQLLICAARGGLERYVSGLLERGADIHGTAGYPTKRFVRKNWTPLHYAADGGHVSTAQRLLESGAQVDHRKDKFVYTPLHLAAASGNRQMVDLLLDHGANANATKFDSSAACHDIFNRWMRVGCKLATFHLAAYGGNKEVWDTLQSRVSNPPKVSGSYVGCSLVPQILAGKRRDGTMTKFLLESFVAGKSKRSLSSIARDVVRGLQLQSQSMETVVKRAVLATLSSIMGEQRHRDDILLQAVANSREKNTENFFQTASRSIDISDDYFGATALVQAAREGDAATAKILLDNGVSANVKGLYNSTPLDSAVNRVLSSCLAREEVFQTIKLLVEYGADVNELPKELHTPSFNPHSRNGNAIKLAKLLLELGVNPNSMDVSGVTPLHVATSNNNYRLIVTLLDNGADPDIRDNTGRKAMAEIEDLEPWSGWDNLHS